MSQHIHHPEGVSAWGCAEIRRGPGGRGAVRIVWCWLLFGCLLAGLAQEAAPREFQIKAAFIYNFTKFVEWPAGSFSNATSPLVIGVCGKSPLREELQAVAQDHKVNGRSIEVRLIQTVAEAGTVHLLFVGSAEEGQAANILAAIQASAVLTVGESEKFTSAGGMIRFVREADKVRFRINVDAAGRAGLRISAQLRKLAQPERRQL